MLIDDGKIKSIDEPVCTYIREWCSGAKARVTLRHLLSMTSGLPRMYEEGVGSVDDKDSFVIKLPLKEEPGSKWDYSNEGVQLLSPILDKAAGEPIQDYARRRLFEPLGMSDTRLHLDSLKHAWTYADMETSARDFARIGLLMLNKGIWGGRRIVSEKWIARSTTSSQTLKPGYGLLWWLFDSPKGFAALGHLDTNLYVFPQEELIVVRMQSKPVDGQVYYSKDALNIFSRLVQK
jgi:CubicO group peptidase (beta-lactamase class C family)